MGQPAIEAIIENSDLKIEKILFLEPEKIDDTLLELSALNKKILIAGGDGTILKAAEMIWEQKNPIGFIPMGTMNLLAQDLGIPSGLEPALKAYAKGTKTMRIDIASLNGHLFLCAAGIGVMPRAAKFREELRHMPTLLLIPRMSLFVFQQLNEMKRHFFNVYMNGKKHKFKTTAIVVSNNRFTNEETGFKKESLQDGLLEIYSAAPRGFWERIRLMIKLGFGVWKNDPVMRSWQAKEIVIYSRKKQELVSLDGETIMVPTPLRFTIEPRALRVLVPLPTIGDV